MLRSFPRETAINSLSLSLHVLSLVYYLRQNGSSIKKKQLVIISSAIEIGMLPIYVCMRVFIIAIGNIITVISLIIPILTPDISFSSFTNECHFQLVLLLRTQIIQLKLCFYINPANTIEVEGSIENFEIQYYTGYCLT